VSLKDSVTRGISFMYTAKGHQVSRRTSNLRQNPIYTHIPRVHRNGIDNHVVPTNPNFDDFIRDFGK